MKGALYGVMLSALLGSGCIMSGSPFTWPGDGATSDQTVLPARKHVPAVRADQLTAENARDKAHELEDELENDREAPK